MNITRDVEQLAVTLSKTGLVSNGSEAMKMAMSILDTEERITNSGSRAYTQTNSKPLLSSKEEIEELIRKTDPEKKNYHIPITGYTREAVKDINVVQADVLADERPLKEVVYELEEPENENALPKENEEKEEFIIDIKEKEPEQLFTEFKENKSSPHEIKNPIEKVDLVSYFKPR